MNFVHITVVIAEFALKAQQPLTSYPGFFNHNSSQPIVKKVGVKKRKDISILFCV